MRTIIILGLLLLTRPALAQPACASLDAEQKKVADTLMAKLHPYDCCDDTLKACLKQKPTCKLVVRLANNLCKRVAAKQEEKQIKRWLSRRGRSMLPGKKAGIDLAHYPPVGDASAKVTVVTYACARCPYCSKIIPEMHRAVAEGPLRGKAKLYFKLFPIKNHPYSKESAQAFLAAGQMGRFWEYVLLMYSRYDKYCVKKQVLWAEEVGLEQAPFKALIDDPELRKRLVASKKEGIVNKVEATPTFFINGRKYVGDLSVEELIDVLEEEFDLVSGATFTK